MVNNVFCASEWGCYLFPFRFPCLFFDSHCFKLRLTRFLYQATQLQGCKTPYRFLLSALGHTITTNPPHHPHGNLLCWLKEELVRRVMSVFDRRISPVNRRVTLLRSTAPESSASAEERGRDYYHTWIWEKEGGRLCDFKSGIPNEAIGALDILRWILPERVWDSTNQSSISAPCTTLCCVFLLFTRKRSDSQW